MELQTRKTLKTAVSVHDALGSNKDARDSRCRPHPVSRADPQPAHPDALPSTCAWSSLSHPTLQAGQQVSSRVTPPLRSPP